MKTARFTSRAAGAAALVAALMLPLSASAVEYTQLKAADSKVAFQYEQMGVKIDGHFKTFSADIQFDPAKPEAARASLTVDLASVNAGSPDADSEVVTAPWFNVPKFPQARFESSSVKATGADTYELAGKLTIKGVTKEVRFPATFKARGDTGAFTGSLTIRRGDFAIGEGDWSTFDIVANDVPITFDLRVAAK